MRINSLTSSINTINQESALSTSRNDGQNEDGTEKIPENEPIESNSPSSSQEAITKESFFNANYLAYQLNTQSFRPTESNGGVFNVSVSATDALGLSTINNQTSTSSPDSSNQTGGNTNPLYSDPGTSGSNPFENGGGDYVPLSTLSTPSTVATSSPTATITNNPLYSPNATTGNNTDSN